MTNFITSAVLGLVLLTSSFAQGQSQGQSKPSDAPWSVQMANSFMSRYPDTISYSTEKRGRWTYEQGVVLEAFHQLWLATQDEKYFTYIKKNIDQFVGEDERIKTYDYYTFNLDNIATGRQLLTLYKSIGEPRYKKAADTLRKQLANQPRTNEGGFWHKKIYPYQMWLDGLYMAEPFYAEYALTFNEPSAFDDIANQIFFVEKHTRDPRTGLLYHGWDESKQQKWADPLTGRSPNFWGRAMGWYMMALVDVLDFFPKDSPKRADIIAILKRLSTALVKYRDHKTGLWYQVIDQGRRKGNYMEASASCMFVYAFTKGADKGYIGRRFHDIAQASFRGIIKKMVTVDKDGLVDLHHTCQGAGLGGNPYRDGSYEYYISEQQRTNDFKAVGPFILAALELEKGKTKKK
jgi:unsaturated rhamnogalacturonyl hydrolase